MANHGLDTPNIDTLSQPNWVSPAVIPQFQQEMADLVWQQLVEPKSELRGRFKILTINPPAGKKRATTEDTIAALITQHAEMKSCLFVSNAPYGPYQATTVRNVLDELRVEGIRIEITSNQLIRDLTTAPLLDTLARTVYTLDTMEHRHTLRDRQKLK